MPFPRFVLRVAALVAVCLLSTGCGGDAAALPDEGPLPVTVIRLEPVDLQKTRMYTGSVEAWNQENLSFEVGGREPKELWLVDSAEHVDLCRSSPVDYKKRVVRFLDEHMRTIER